MSEAEQYWMRLRLQGGKMSKARRGELRFQAPMGYEWDPSAARFRFDPDARIHAMIHLVFERFRIAGSAYGVMRYLADQGLRMPVRDHEGGDLRWVLPRHSLLLNLLRNPTYAGAYVYGRREQRTALVNGEVRRRHLTRLAQDAWKVVLYDHHPAYVSWDEYLANQRQLAGNRTVRVGADHRGAAREGAALLQGLVLCGRCGHRMTVNYQGHQGHAQYECRSPTKVAGRGEVCWTVSAHAIDDAVAALFLKTVTPPEIDLALAIAGEVDAQAATVDRQWTLRLEHARYEARLAERRYKVIDPENRVVARTLEREWNECLREIEDLEREQATARQHARVVLTDADRAQIRTLARDLPRVWRATTTSQTERKNLLRLVLREVSLSPVEIPARGTHVQVLWKTDAVTALEVPRPDRKTARATPTAALALLRAEVAKGTPDDAIATALNAHDIRTGCGRRWDVKAVQWARSRHGLRRPYATPPGVPLPARRADGLYSVHGVAHRLCVTEHIVHDWVQRGILRGTEGGGLGRAWWFKLDAATMQRLRRAKAQGYGPRMGRHSETPS